MKINTVIKIAKKLGMNIDELEVVSAHNVRDGYTLFDGEKAYTITFILTDKEFMSAMASPDGIAKTHVAGKIENIDNSKEIYDLLTFIITNKLI